MLLKMHLIAIHNRAWKYCVGPQPGKYKPCIVMNAFTENVFDWFTDCVWEKSRCGEMLNTNPVAVMSDPISRMSATWEIQIWFRYIIHITANLEHQVYSIPQQRTQIQPLNWLHTPTSIFALVKLNFTFQLISLWILCNAKATIARFSTKTKQKKKTEFAVISSWCQHLSCKLQQNFNYIFLLS